MSWFKRLRKVQQDYENAQQDRLLLVNAAFEDGVSERAIARAMGLRSPGTVHVMLRKQP